MSSILQAQRLYRSSENLSITKIISYYCSKELHIQSPPILRVNCTPSLNVSRNFWETFPFSRRTLHVKDRLDEENHKLIYRTKLFNYSFYAQLISMGAITAQTVFGFYYAYQGIMHQTGPAMTEFAGLPITYDMATLMVLGIFTAHNIAVYYIAQRVLLRGYYKASTDEYIFVGLDSNPFQSRLVYCKPGDLQPLNRKGLLSIFGNYKIKDRTIFMRFSNFYNIMHYNRLLSKQGEFE